jgi:hypothetical protein
MGMMYLFDLPFLIIGFFELLKHKNKNKIFILGWLFLGPISSSLTRDLTSARRSLNMLVPLLIISSLGYIKAYGWLKESGQKYLKSVLLIIFSVSFIYFTAFYFSSYFIFTRNRSFKGPSGWYCGYKELVNYINAIKKDSEEIIVDTSYQGPYIFFLFYEKYPPERYQPQAKLIQDSPDSLGEGQGYDKYIFRPIYWPGDRGLADRLFAGPPERIPEKDIQKGQSEIVKRLYFPDGEESFRIVRVFNK